MLRRHPVCEYLPVDRDREDALDVGQHCLEMVRILLEAHFCQHQRLADVWDEKHKFSLCVSSKNSY